MASGLFMNFKPTVLKSISSVVSGIIVDYLIARAVAGTIKVACLCPEGVPCICPQPTWIKFAFTPFPLLISIMAMSVVYVVWSFMQKK